MRRRSRSGRLQPTAQRGLPLGSRCLGVGRRGTCSSRPWPGGLRGRGCGRSRGPRGGRCPASLGGGGEFLEGSGAALIGGVGRGGDPQGREVLLPPLREELEPRPRFVGSGRHDLHRPAQVVAVAEAGANAETTSRGTMHSRSSSSCSMRRRRRRAKPVARADSEPAAAEGNGMPWSTSHSSSSAKLGRPFSTLAARRCGCRRSHAASPASTSAVETACAEAGCAASSRASRRRQHCSSRRRFGCRLKSKRPPAMTCFFSGGVSAAAPAFTRLVSARPNPARRRNGAVPGSGVYFSPVTSSKRSSRISALQP